MPQMAPLSWTILFTFFIILFIMMNTMNYYMSTPKISTSQKKTSLSSKIMNWKW
uniref:ATP synthase F0 subunit 8 n=1 Tax=Chlorogomphus shanicus TaxID=2077256 RepID=UPI0023AA5912|nr:ATP synthase F0 subunit 8 [Chlorogomphus shanicus]WCO11395.1 ATP synthase F0 subunit 8 [Chlorogomphus shanicus]